MIKTVFIIGTVWVEPKSSAAGSRMLQLIRFFQSKDYKVIFGSTALKSQNSFDLESIDVFTHQLKLNDVSFDKLLLSISPEIVVFDRFMTEEQFGWRVTENCPKAIKILDTEDLHCLRKTRQLKAKLGQTFRPSDLLNQEITKREIASIYRCDLSLIISKFEMKILKEIFKIDTNLLLYLPFLLDKKLRETSLPSYEERKHFISIGNFLHRPNLEAVLLLKREIWFRIKSKIPDAELHIYGAYPTQQVLELHNPKDGFFVHGHVKNHNKVLQNIRVLLAPLTFGAGLKGKFIDAMLNECPSVTTSMGIEGISNKEDWSGKVTDNWADFADFAVELYSNKKLWDQSKLKGTELLKQFDKENYDSVFSNVLEHLFTHLDEHRKRNFLGSLLQYHTFQSTKYLSKWIEEKNK